jgi:hypothetical protein
MGYILNLWTYDAALIAPRDLTADVLIVVTWGSVPWRNW